MAKMYEVIEQLCSERDIKPGKMCADLKISRGILSDLKAGRTKKLSAKNLALIANYLQVSTDYILKQSGFTELFEGVGGASFNWSQYMKDVSTNIANRIDEASNSAPDIPNIIPLPETKKIPLLGTIACGEPILAVENIEDYITVIKSLNVDFALTCKGDSMINARIFDGDIVYIHQQDMVESGDIAAVLIDDEATLKRVKLYPDHIVLQPENPMYPPMAYWHEEMNNVRILGKAVAFVSAVR